MEIRVVGNDMERLVITVHGYAYPDTDCYWDGNWLTCGVEATVSGFTAAYPAAVRVDEVGAFLGGVEQLRDARSGKARLKNMDNTIELTLQPDKFGRLMWSGRLTPPTGQGTSLAFAFRAEPASLPDLIRDARSVVAAYPVRGVPAAEGV